MLASNVQYSICIWLIVFDLNLELKICEERRNWWAMRIYWHHLFNWIDFFLPNNVCLRQLFFFSFPHVSSTRFSFIINKVIWEENSNIWILKQFKCKLLKQEDVKNAFFYSILLNFQCEYSTLTGFFQQFTIVIRAVHHVEIRRNDWTISESCCIFQIFISQFLRKFSFWKQNRSFLELLISDERLHRLACSAPCWNGMKN